jgi:hypothetical protein
VGPLYLVVVAVSACTALISPYIPMLLIFWLKPWLDRSVLFVLSRGLFGQSTRFQDLWKAQRAVWWASLWRTLTLGRLSLRRSFTLPIEQLEGQHGRALRQRRAVLLSGQRGQAFYLQVIFAHVEAFLVLAVCLLPLILVPWSIWPDLTDWMEAGAPGVMWLSLLQYVAYVCVVGFVEPFFVGAGFGLYISRRVQLEAWDIEQEFRRAFG